MIEKNHPFTERFHKNGFSVARSLIPSAEIAELEKTLSAKYLGEKLQFFSTDIVNNIPELRPYATDGRVLNAVRHALATDDIRFLQCGDVHFNLNAGWHRDSANRRWGGLDWDAAYGPYGCVKIIIYMQCSDFGLGVVPGSHRFPLPIEDLVARHQNAQPLIIAENEEVPIFDFDEKNWSVVVPLMRPGDAIIFDMRLYHCGHPLKRISEETRNTLRQQKITGYTDDKSTFSLTYGPQNVLSERFYSFIRFHRADLKYRAMDAQFVESLKRHDIALSSGYANILEQNPALIEGM